MDPASPEATATGDAAGPVRRRHVFYVPGYDPRSPRAYFLLFSRELRKFAALHGIAASLKRISEPALPDRPAARWRLTAGWPGAEVETTLDVLDWHDLVARDFAKPKWRRLLLSLRVLWDTTATGTLGAMIRLNWKFGLFSIYPWVMMALYLAAAAGIAWVAILLARAAGLPGVLGLLSALPVFHGLLRLTDLLDAKLYVWYLVNDWIFTWRHRTGRGPEVEARFERFAHTLVAARASEADEILVVGHSSGSFVALGIVARALELDATIGAGRPTLRILTLGANLPIAAAGRLRSPTRAAIAALATEERVTWVDYFAPQDVLNFPWLDPVAAFGIHTGDRPRRNPHVRSARLKEIMTPERYAAMAWHFYDTHFAFLQANDIHGEYDFYRFLAGPDRLESVLTR